jgi:uncharacterized membrane protein YcaP (DUF421 family)
MLFDDWYGPLRVVIVGLLAYLALVVFLRVSGKRTLTKWNAFDFVITVALGSTLAAALLDRDVTFVEGASAFALLIGLQFVITWLSVRFTAVERLVKARPTLLLSEGRLLESALRAQRVTTSEILAAARGAGVASLEELEAMVLETDGSFSVIRKAQRASRSALVDVSSR